MVDEQTRRVTDVALRAAGSDGRHRLESLTAKLYEGTLDPVSEADQMRALGAAVSG